MNLKRIGVQYRRTGEEWEIKRNWEKENYNSKNKDE